jgi:8-oxo-dGTP pyrophosphatase MutT (NUDIX family)
MSRNKSADDNRRPVTPRDAASLVILRKRRRGLEVLMGRRASKHRFMPNVFVFPGGRLDTADMTADVEKEFRPDVAEKLERKWTRDFARGLGVAAVRETMEETGLELGPITGDTLKPDLSSLDYLARAITPTSNPIRFHARFFSADVEQARGKVADSMELRDLAWRSLEDSLTLPIADVTEFVLQELQRRQAGWQPPGVPLFCYRGGSMMIHYEG